MRGYHSASKQAARVHWPLATLLILGLLLIRP
jgi:hypothetical protein